ncbi:MAG: phosphatidylglycerol lysyltransferase domain-containing protein [Oscillospiraceae bacterium]|nr:phosphatidylglycerol lysyltransferase domain-containing protein [Oscillospiraceae bacterium]
MIEFRNPELSDRPWVDELFFAKNNRGCEYSFTNLYCWKDAYQQKVARVNDYVVQYLSGSIGPCYPFPVGRGELKPVLEALMEDARRQNHPFRLICVTNEEIQQLEALYPGQFTYSEDRHGFDYLYEIDKLADLKGKKLHGKRNHIHRFEENYPDWAAEPVTEDNLAECLAMDVEWYRLNRGYSDDEEEINLGAEGVALRLAIRHFTALSLEGLLIRAGGKVVAFTLGRKLSEDTFDINFEKAYSEIQGAYPIVNREFARQIRQAHPEIRYLNREDDMGVEGLRKAKESYYPDLMVVKHSAILK